MKNKIITLLISALVLSINVFAQDSLHKSTMHKQMVTHKSHMSSTMHHSVADTSKAAKKPMYRDTRLGSSSPKYNTYKKNKNGAGAVTTSPK